MYSSVSQGGYPTWLWCKKKHTGTSPPPYICKAGPTFLWLGCTPEARIFLYLLGYRQAACFMSRVWSALGSKHLDPFFEVVHFGKPKKICLNLLLSHRNYWSIIIRNWHPSRSCVQVCRIWFDDVFCVIFAATRMSQWTYSNPTFSDTRQISPDNLEAQSPNCADLIPVFKCSLGWLVPWVPSDVLWLSMTYLLEVNVLQVEFSA